MFIIMVYICFYFLFYRSSQYISSLTYVYTLNIYILIEKRKIASLRCPRIEVDASFKQMGVEGYKEKANDLRVYNEYIYM
jgi:hypothetical protein